MSKPDVRPFTNEEIGQFVSASAQWTEHYEYLPEPDCIFEVHVVTHAEKGVGTYIRDAKRLIRDD